MDNRDTDKPPAQAPGAAEEAPASTTGRKERQRHSSAGADGPQGSASVSVGAGDGDNLDQHQHQHPAQPQDVGPARDPTDAPTGEPLLGNLSRHDTDSTVTLPLVSTTAGAAVLAVSTIETEPPGAISCGPGVIPVSPHPAPSSFGPGSPTSRQQPHTAQSSSLENNHNCDTNLIGNNIQPPQPAASASTSSLSGPETVPSFLHHTHPLHQPLPAATKPPTNSTVAPVEPQKMIFTDLYKSPRSPLSKLRHANHTGLAPGWTDFDADLVSKDKLKQKEAVKRHLQSKVKNDWSFTWPQDRPKPTVDENPPPLEASDDAPQGQVGGYLEIASESAEARRSALDEETASNPDHEAEPDSDAESVYSSMSEDPLHWRPRLEWTSELSDDELPYNSPSSFKFDTPDSIAQAVTAAKNARKARRRKELRQEIAWNDGLACFEARRNAWTGAKVAQVHPKPASPVSPSLHTRKAFFWRTHTHSSSNASQTAVSPNLTTPLTPTNSYPEAGQPSSAGTESDVSVPTNSLSPKITRSDSHQTPDLSYVETLLPIPPPLLPPTNPMRASINPTLYNSIYEKVVVHSLQPSCPINLSDMIRACVSGWKRDGEWPPRATVPEPAAVVAIKRKKSNMSTAKPGGSPSRRKMSFSFLNGYGRGHDGDKEKDKTRRESATGDDGSGGLGTGKVIRRSLQKVLGIGHSPTMASVGDGSAAAQQH